MSDKKLVSIRGAITAKNNAQAIAEASRKLIERIYFKNALTDRDVVNVMCSSSADLTAFYPARAVREAGHAVPLFSCVEPSVAGSLASCIRFMVTAYSDKPVQNVYIGKARALRGDLCDTFSIALDGPSGAGKSTVAKAVSAKLGITYLDTGALYRALGLEVLSRGISPRDAESVEKCLSNVAVTIEYRDGVQCVLLNGEDVSGRIRTPEVSMAASDVAVCPSVRRLLVAKQQEIAASNDVVMDGRDIGTHVLPDAQYKFFLTASPEVRAMRRFDELRDKGQAVAYDDVLEDVKRRDEQDTTRKESPLTRAADATEVSTDDLNADEVVQVIMALMGRF